MSDLKYSVGIDVSKDSFRCCFSVIDDLQQVKVKASRSFDRNEFNNLFQWIKRHRKRELPLVITMEATGCYHEELAWYLFKNEYSVSVVLPNKAKRYMQSLGLKSKNDSIDAQGLARMGAQQKLEAWQPVSEKLYQLRALTRQHQRLQELKTTTQNQLHAAQYSRIPVKEVMAQLKQMIKLLDKQLAQNEQQIEKMVQSDEELSRRVTNICSVKGLGLLTVATIIAETDGFALIKNQRQVTSYAGYDVVENQSGKHTGKTKISKRGNARIRRALHMPALNVVKHEPRFNSFYNRIFQRSGIKMKGYVAVQRKLLVLIYTLWTKDEAYNPEQHQPNTSGIQETKPLFQLNIVGKPTGLPTLDELPSNQSTEALFQLETNLKKVAEKLDF